MSREPILRAEGITKRVPGVVALSGVTFDLAPGEIHALCGENGAGKSTLIKLLSGLHAHGSYEGELTVAGRPARFRSVADAEKAGIAVICQELALVPEMTAAENLFLGAEPTRAGLIDWASVYGESKALFERFGVRIDPRARTSDLGTGQQQLVEILKALRKDSRVLILDEPTAALTETETAVLIGILKDLRRRGISCIYISHRLEEVFELADRITVLRDGSTVATLDRAKTDVSAVIRHMVGREIKDLFPRRASAPGKTLLRVSGLNAAAGGSPRAFLKDVSFEARAGEVVGFGGLMGAGRSELLMHLFGAWGRRLSGTVELMGVPLGAVTPETALERGLALVTEDRRRYGLVLEHPISFNLSLSSLKKLTAGLLLDLRLESSRNREQASALRVKAPDLGVRVGGLSGGNQQKVVLGRVLMAEPSVIFLDEPTRGIDVGAKIEVYEIINALTASGKAVVLVSSELPELMGMSDRILMLHDGRVSAEFAKAEATQENLLAAAMGRARN
ncbi:MAG: sugar ABC transporter ATP-binding protein [Elusimicrobia bacterium]|nr:sugar ABC transporter ATP-binding protein [Elusimicrobiota bacterium]